MNENVKASAEKKPKRLRRRLKIAALVIAGLILLVFLTCGSLMFWGSRRIQREIQSTRALNEPTNWDELMRTDRQGHVVGAGSAAAEGQAAALYSKALGLSRGWSKALPQPFQSELGKEVLSAEEVGQLGEALSNYQEALDLLRKAVEYDGMVNMPGSSVMPDKEQFDELNSMREAARLLGAQANYLANRGRGDEAADTCVVLLRYARAFPGNNMLGGLVQIAVSGAACLTIEQTLAMAPCSAERLEALRKELERSVDDTPLARVFCGERVCGNQLFQSEMMGLPRFVLWPNHAAYLEVLRDFIRFSREPFPASLHGVTASDSPYRRRPAGPLGTLSSLAYTLVPALQSALDKGAATQAQVRATLVNVAIRRAKLDGAPLPTRLQELVPKYLSAVPTDPFTGEPLRYKVDESGCTIYSVGRDGVDDGGAIEVKARRSGGDTKDIGVFLAP
jgi:tetratricopeptide (TPR) repeat protein